MGTKVYKTVNARGTSTPSLHADEGCRALANSEVTEKDESAFPDWYPRCSRCMEGSG